MWVTYRGSVTRGFFRGKRGSKKFKNKEDVLRIFHQFPPKEKSWRVSQESKDNWEYIREAFLKNVESQIVRIEESLLVELLPSFLIEQLEAIGPKEGARNILPIFWGDLLRQLGYMVEKPECLHRRIKLIDKAGMAIVFSCLDCDARFQCLSSNTCSHCGGMLEEVEVKEIPAIKKELTFKLKPPSVKSEEKTGTGFKTSLKCRNCGKSTAYKVGLF